MLLHPEREEEEEETEKGERQEGRELPLPPQACCWAKNVWQLAHPCCPCLHASLGLPKQLYTVLEGEGNEGELPDSSSWPSGAPEKAIWLPES